MHEVQAREDSQAAGAVDDGIHIGRLTADRHEVDVLVLKLGECLDDESKVLTLLDTPDEEDIALGEVQCLTCHYDILGRHRSEGFGATLIDGRHTLLLDAEDIDDITARLVTHGDDVVGMTGRRAVLLAVEQAVDGLVELWVADEGQVVHSDDRAYALGVVQPDGKLIGQPVEEVDLLRTAARGHGEVAPEIAPCEGQCTMRRDEPHRAIGQQAFVERGVTRRGREEQIAILWAELRERVEHEAAVVPEAGSIVCNALGIEGDIHRLSEATRGIRDGDGCTTSPR